MSIWNLGSISEQVQEVVDIPMFMKGERLLNMIDKRRIFVQNNLGVSIGSNAIADKYQDAIYYFTMSKVLGTVDSTDTQDTSEVKLGDFVIKKGKDNNLALNEEGWHKMGMQELSDLKRQTSGYGSFKALG